MTFCLGLTGSIGMGKSTTAGFFAEAGIPVWDADAAVRRLYEPGGAAALAIAARYPGATGPGGGVLRPVLRDMIRADPAVLDWLNATVHPLTAADRARFLQDHADAPIVLLDIRCSMKRARMQAVMRLLSSLPRPRHSAPAFWRGARCPRRISRPSLPANCPMRKSAPARIT